MPKFRVSTLSAARGIPSKYLVNAFKCYAPDLNVRSASSRVEFNTDNQIFIKSVMSAAKEDANRSQKVN